MLAITMASCALSSASLRVVLRFEFLEMLCDDPFRTLNKSKHTNTKFNSFLGNSVFQISYDNVSDVFELLLSLVLQRLISLV